MEQKKKRGRPRTMERERAVMLAMENYWREGMQSLSVNEICRRTQLSKPSLYREFGGEDGLHNAALECYERVVLLPMAAEMSTQTSFADGMKAMIHMLTAPRELPMGCLLVKMRGAQETLGPLTRERVSKMVEGLQQGYQRMFLLGRDRGEVRQDVSPELAARYMDTQVTTILHQTGAGENSEEIQAQASLAFSALLKEPGTWNL